MINLLQGTVQYLQHGQGRFFTKTIGGGHFF